MNRIIASVCLMLAMSVAPAFAETPTDQGHCKNAPQQGQHMMDGMSGHAMHHETPADMPDLIGRMNDLLMKMAHAMPASHASVTEHAKMKEMGGVMHDMAKVLDELAVSMDQGKMDKQALDAMHDRIKAIQQKIDGPNR